jgi:hypothetical protein
MMVKSLLANLLKRFGYEVIASSKVAPSNMSRRLKALFEKLAIDCVLDVGANVGQYADLLRNAVGYRGLIISFEPVKQNFDLLSEKSKNDPGWYIHDFALGSEDTNRPINVMRAAALSSFLEPDDSSEYDKIEHREAVELKKSIP